MQLIKSIHNFLRSKNSTFKTVIFTFQLLVFHIMVPKEAKAQETSSTAEVVVGYGTVKRNDLTGAVTEINVKDINKAPVSSFTEALGGRASGLEVVTPDGKPGVNINMMVRSPNYNYLQNGPLYVIDGAIVLDIEAAALNMEDIEVINVLKDGGAAAIYGANASNGVVIIQTKRGKEGKPVLSFQNAFGFQEVNKQMELRNPYEFVKYRSALNPETAVEKYFSDGKTLSFYENEKGEDWANLIFRKSPVRLHNLSFRGGSSKTRYAVSGANFDQQGIIRDSNFEKYQGRVSIDQDIASRFTVGVMANYSKLSNAGENYVERSNLGYRLAGADRNETSNWANFLSGPTSVDDRSYLQATAYINYAITKDLTFKTTGAIIERIQRINGQVKNNTNYMSQLSFTDVKRDYWSNDNTLTYHKIMANKHQIKVLSGFAQRKEKAEMNSASFSSAGDLAYNLDIWEKLKRWRAANEIGLPPINTSSSAFMKSKLSIKSYFGRLFYGYDSKYLIEGSYRADESTFNHKWQHNASVAFAWNMHEESFLKEATALSVSKLRMSYGKEKGISIIADQFNVGYDLGLFHNRLELTVDVYKKTNEILMLSFPPVFPDYNQLYNFLPSKMQNQGLEVNLSTVNLKTASFSWLTNFNISFNKNEVLYLNARSFDDINAQGQYIGPGLSHLSVNPSLGALYHAMINKSALNSEIRMLPLHTGGLTNNLSYKDFDLHIFLQWSYGNHIYHEKAFEKASFLKLKTGSFAYNLPLKTISKLYLGKLQFHVSAQNLLTFSDYSGMDPDFSLEKIVYNGYSLYPQNRTLVFGVNASF